MGRSRSARALPGLVAIVLASCGAAAGSPPTAAPTTIASGIATPPTTPAVPTPTAPPALVGEWFGVHNCQLIFDDLTAAGMPDQALLNIVDAGVLPGVVDVSDIKDPKHPCVGAVEVKHSHFFNPNGTWGSRDATGNQVDDGIWKIVDATTFTIGDVPFHYTIASDELHMEPIAVGPCPTNGDWCQQAWKVMVAMPGMAWKRG